jgi:hypothetical protein
MEAELARARSSMELTGEFEKLLSEELEDRDLAADEPLRQRQWAARRRPGVQRRPVCEVDVALDLAEKGPAAAHRRAPATIVASIDLGPLGSLCL